MLMAFPLQLTANASVFPPTIKVKVYPLNVDIVLAPPPSAHDIEICALLGVVVPGVGVTNLISAYTVTTMERNHERSVKRMIVGLRCWTGKRVTVED